MKVRIHRGTHEIGGTCIEVEAQGKRIVLDVGLPLDVDYEQAEIPAVSGFDVVDETLLGVLISHPHQDHYGLMHKVKAGVRFFIGPAARRIIEAASPFTRRELLDFGSTTPLVDRAPIRLGPFTITPFLMDHSAYDAYAFLIEADGQLLFYSGDFRAHGRKESLFKRLVADPPRGIDVLLMEGTCVGRPEEGAVTEEALVPRMVSTFQKTAGMALVWCSGQNIDRLVTVFKAAKKAQRTFIIDGYTARILMATENKKLMQPDWDGIKVFWQLQHRLAIKKNGWFDLVNGMKCLRVHSSGRGELLNDVAARSVVLFRPSMLDELVRARCLEGATLVYSLWKGYLERPDGVRLQKRLDRRGIPLEYIHTSGHASVPDLRRFAKALDPKVLVPIHSAHPDRFSELFDKVEPKEDGVWWEVGSR